jgi:hypothetical protein
MFDQPAECGGFNLGVVICHDHPREGKYPLMTCHSDRLMTSKF